MTQATPFRTGHIGLNVTDLNRSSKFYQDIFGFQEIKASHEEGREFAFLADGDTLVLTLWKQSEGQFSPSTPGLHHLSFQVNSIDDVRSAEGRVRSSGARLHHNGIVPHAEGAQSGGIFFEDPDGTRLEIFTATGADEASAPNAGGAPTCGFF